MKARGVRHAGLVSMAVVLTLLLAGCPRPAQVSITPTTATIHVDETIQLTGSSTRAQDTIEWSSNHPAIATVDEQGLVSGVAPGEASIVAQGSQSGAEATLTVTVLPAIEGEVREHLVLTLDYLKEAPPDVLDPERRSRMEASLGEARELFAREGACPAAEVLEDYLEEAAGLREELVAGGEEGFAPDAPLGYAELLQAQGRQLQYRMLATQAEDPCAAYPGVERIPETSLEEADLEGVAGEVLMGAPQLWPVIRENLDGKEEVFTELQFPGVDAQAGEPGKPGIPSVRELVAVPLGASIDVEIAPRTGTKLAVNLYPTQEHPWDQTYPGDDKPPLEFFGDRPFTQDVEQYATDAPYPDTPVKITPMGRVRGMDLIQVEIFAGQYNPVQNTLELFDEIEYDIRFSKGQESFTRDPFNNFEQIPVYTGPLLNWGPVLEWGPIIIEPTRFGAEFLIITHPDFAEAASALRDWKLEKGLSTAIYHAGIGSGVTGRETNTEIKAFIETYYQNALVKPSYILLLGDSDHIQPFIRTGIWGGIGTDWPYAVLTAPGGGDSDVPSFAVGRMPVRDAQEAQAVVDKIILYESAPPQDAGFYRNITLAAQFQGFRLDVPQPGTAQRTFTEAAEFARDAVTMEGYTAQRIYERTIDAAYTHPDTTPRYYYDGAPLPSAIGPGSGFAWDGTRDDVTDAFDEGRFLILHRDHGWRHGWGHPPLHTNNVNALTNDLLPVVFSINCTTGLFDNEFSVGAGGSSPTGEYFSEALLRNPNGGAVGVIGATRISPSWPNSVFVRGLFDAIWPNSLSTFGGPESHRRLGDIMNHAKLYVATQYSGDTLNTMNYLYHVLGDPTLEIWTESPFVLRPPIFELLELIEQRIIFEYPNGPEGAEVTLFQTIEDEMTPVGRGYVEDGEVVVDFEIEPNVQADFYVGVSAENAVSVDGVLDVYREQPMTHVP